jgi:HTH-type transcriptional regulator/antitoxin MqsA
MIKTCVRCDAEAEMVPFAGEMHRVSYRGATAEVMDLSGFRCPACGEIEFDAASAERYAAAGDALVLAERQAAGEELRRIRKKLRINQIEASRLTGGGHNAFSRYETGKVAPPPAVMNLFRLLDRHPESIEVLRRVG